jgi:hypothetical protein
LSKRADRLAADVVNVVLERTGVEKSGQQAGLLFAVARPMAAAIVDRDRALKRAAKGAKKRNREVKAIRRTLDAIAYPGHAVAPGSRMADFRPAEWRTVLAPAAAPQRNGHPYPGVNDGQEER